MAPFAGAAVTVPALYMAGERDFVAAVFSEFIAKQSALVPKLRPPIMLPGCGHWTQQERAPEVSTAMIDFLRSSYARTRTRTSGNDKVVAVLGARLDMRPVEQDFGLRDQRGVSLVRLLRCRLVDRPAEGTRIRGREHGTGRRGQAPKHGDG